MSTASVLELPHPVRRVAAAVDALLDEVAGLDLAEPHLAGAHLAGLGSAGPGSAGPDLSAPAGAELDAAVRAWDRLESRVRTVKLRLVAAGARGRRDRATGAPNPAAWVAGVLHADPGAARAAVAQARVLADATADPLTAPLVDAAASGAVPVSVAVRAAEAVAALPDGCSDAVRRRAAELVRARAGTGSAAEVRAYGERVLVDADPVDGERLLARHREEQVRRAAAARSLVLGGPVDGLVPGRFALPTDAAATVSTALRALARPRPAGAAGPDGPTSTSGGPDPRSAEQRMADALVELAERELARGTVPDTGGERPHLVVTIGWEQLRARVGEATTADGDGLAPSVARRIACDAAVLPVVLGSAGQPMDVGRSTRVVPAGLRRALAVRDGGCAFPGCGRPVSWCDAHHVRHWADGGGTCLDNLVLLCGHHHRVVHTDRWVVTVDRAAGRPGFRPPPWVAPSGTVWDSTGRPPVHHRPSSADDHHRSPAVREARAGDPGSPGGRPLSPVATDRSLTRHDVFAGHEQLPGGRRPSSGDPRPLFAGHGVGAGAAAPPGSRGLDDQASGPGGRGS